MIAFCAFLNRLRKFNEKKPRVSINLIALLFDIIRHHRHMIKINFSGIEKVALRFQLSGNFAFMSSRCGRPREGEKHPPRENTRKRR